MFENIKEAVRLFFKSRLTVAGILMTILFGIVLWRMFSLQIVNGEEYQNNYTLKIVKERTLNSTRGNIYDRNGNLLAYNELAYSITIEDNGSYANDNAKNLALNSEIAQIITALEANGDSITNDFRIDMEANGDYRFNVKEGNTAWKRFLADVYGETSYNDLGYNKKLGYDTSVATEDQIMEYLSHKLYGIDEELYDPVMTYKITVIRFAMAQNAYQKYISTTIATNVSEESVTYISEHSSELQGVEVVDDTVRRYNDSVYFSSILGYTGKISAEDYEKLSQTDDSYTLNDVVGKVGIEQYMDSTLKGTKGYEKLYVDYLGKAIEIIEREEPEAGNDVYLSIDRDLQIVAYDLLEQEIAGIVYSNIENSKSDINIPITDVYFALINNNVIDIDAFSDADASAAEQEVQAVFTARQSAVAEEMRTELMGADALDFADMNEEFQDYITYIIDQLKSAGILVTDNIDTTDEIYQQWREGSISPQDYLNYAIAKGWIDITRFTLEEKYSDSVEIYESLCSYIMDEITTQNGYSKITYQYLVAAGSVTGKQLCMILFDQGVLAYNEEDVTALSNGSLSALNFMKDKIKNLEITPAQLALDPCSGSCVITDVNTGELLALVSYPGYDNNRLANSVDAEYFASLQVDKSLPQYNYATQQATAPGSTFKMVSATAGLAEGVITLDETIQDKGQYENVDNKPKCWIFPNSTHGSINVSEALRDSCNYFFYEVGYRLSTNNYLLPYDDALGISKLQQYATLYGLNESTGIEIEETIQSQMADSFPVMAAIGQSNNNYTTVQLGRYVTAVANSGTVYNYTLLNRVEDSEGNVLQTFQPQVRNTIDVLNQSEWDAIHSGMRMVVEELSSFDDFPVVVAGKTGTAQQDLRRANHALFVSYAPYDKPEISVATRIAYGYTSHNAAEYAKNVYAYYFHVEDEEELLNGQAEDVNSGSNSVTD
ncbi:MAG: penicillin-binding transpeptidase domain-containing protein [Roseburia sp.]